MKRSRERSRESSVDSSSEDSEQRRRRKKRKKKRKEEKRQRRKEKKKQRKKDKLVLTDQWGKYGVIRACDIVRSAIRYFVHVLINSHSIRNRMSSVLGWLT